MARKTLRAVLKTVDPQLNVVGHGHSRKRAEQNWQAATGITCASCKTEVFRSRDGLCMECWEKREETKVEVLDKTNILGWLPDTILEQITHKSGK